MTSFAPLSLAICMPMMPTPELAPWMMMLSPGCSRALVTIASCIVPSALGKVAACSQLILLPGMTETRPQSATVYSA